ncbi:hypothetical protein Tco_1456540 [Tanacetum coccineum]
MPSLSITCPRDYTFESQNSHLENLAYNSSFLSNSSINLSRDEARSGSEVKDGIFWRGTAGLIEACECEEEQGQAVMRALYWAFGYAFWAAQGPERQQAAAAGALEADEDGQAAEEAALEILALAPAPAQAPPPLPPAPQPRTMS